MNLFTKPKNALTIFAIALLVSCNNDAKNVDLVTNTDTVVKTKVDTVEVPPPEQRDTAQINVVVDISERKVFVLRQGDTLRNYEIAVGKAKYPTPTGSFKIHRIDWNPDWTPPDSEWSEDDEYTPPGHPDNPMGRVRIVYQMPYTIHGTDNLKSLGKAQSHGSIRVANENVIELAKLIMQEAETGKSDDWYQRVLKDSTTMVSVDLNQTVPLTNKK